MRRLGALIAASLLLLLAVVAPVTGLWAGEPGLSLLEKGTWVEDPLGKPVIDRGPRGAWDHVAVDNPFVTREGETFYCFFEAENAEHQEQVGLATSTDLLHWTKHEGNPVLRAGPPGAWDHQAAKLPVVARHGDTYHMLYTGKDGRGHAAIGLATSKDLRHWTKVGDGPILPGRPGSWDPILTTCPTLVKRNGVYHLIYRGMTGFYRNQKLGLATSKDLLHWTRPDKPLAALDGIYSFATCAEPIGGTYVALSQRSQVESFFLSDDLATWTRGPRARFHPAAIETPSNPFVFQGRLWIVYEKRDRIGRSYLARGFVPPRPVLQAVPVRDDFAEASAARRRWHTVGGSWVFEGGKCRQTATGAEWCRAVAWTKKLSACDLTASVRPTGGKGWVGLCAAHGSGLYAFAIVHDGRKTARLFRSASGRWGKAEWVEDVPCEPRRNAPYALRIKVSGKTIQCFIDGHKVIEKSDPQPLAPGRCGLFTAGAAAEFDDVVLTGTPAKE